MKTICPYCGKQQPEKNKICQFCGAALVKEQAPGEKKEEAKEPAVSLCNVCLRSFPTAELVEHEGQRICTECARKVKKRETALAPVMKKAVEEEPLRRPARKFIAVFFVGVVVLAAVGYGSYYLWGMFCVERGRRIGRVAEMFKPVIEKNNRAVAFLHQHETEATLAAEAVNLLADAFAEVSGDEMKEACKDEPGLNEYRAAVRELLMKRLSAARALAGKPEAGDPANKEEALRLVTEADESAASVTAGLAKKIRLWRVSAEPFLIY